MSGFSLQERLTERLTTLLSAVPRRYLYVNTREQRLLDIRDGEIAAGWPVSTSRFGIGNHENSGKTPLGIHRISQKYGDGAPIGRIFVSREDTGRDWNGDTEQDNLILTRILRLEGLEAGINRGPGIDSFERYIYIHGTNREEQIGTPLSHGCICMRNSDVIELFDLTPEGTIVIID
jgi:UDP-N-acetylmuramate--alanine ligase